MRLPTCAPPTPTDAGKRIVPDISEETARITEARARLDRAVLGYVGMQMNYIAQHAADRCSPTRSPPCSCVWRS